jgi:alpha-1,3-rhamnosyl/mannosyltransferase
VVTVHDLFFLQAAPTGTDEIARDYPRLAASHAQRAHAVVTSSEYGRREVIDRLRVDSRRVHVVSPGSPAWQMLGRGPNLPAAGYVLFVGTLDARKNVGTLLDAWARVLREVHPQPRLVLAGRATPHAQPWLERLTAAPFLGTVEHRGYVAEQEREALYAGARALVLPSLDEGFGLPVLEAMSAGIPVIASDRGAIPEVTAGAADLIAPTDVAALSDALVRVLTDERHALDLAARGLTRAAAYSWERSAAALATVYEAAVTLRQQERT